MKKQITLLLLVLISISQAQTNNDIEVNKKRATDCIKKKKIVGAWYQEDKELSQDNIEENGFSLHFSKAKTELNIKKNKTYNYKSEMSMTFNIKEFKIYNAKVFLKQVGNGNWSIDCKHIMYKNENNKMEYEIDDELKKNEELYKAMLKIIENFSKNSEIKEVESQKVLEISKKVIITDKKIYTRL